MYIGRNTTGMPAALSVATDKHGRDHCIVVVKGTFTIRQNGEPVLSEEQEPLVYADVHYGDPGTSSVRYESDFAPFKPRADIIVNGHAVSPTAKPVAELLVTLEVGALRKSIMVFGDRRWKRGILGLYPSPPEPFLIMPLLYERSYGGSDHSDPNPRYQGTEVRNPIGVGFHKNPDRRALRDTPLPNLEDPQHLIRKWSETPPPTGFGIIGRNWEPRLQHAGTYDELWLRERFPFLPEDFDTHYFQLAPADQQIPFLKGGEVVRCTNMTPEGSFEFVVPTLEVPIVFKFRDRDVRGESSLDSMTVEPDQRRILLTWRAAVPVGRKPTALRVIWVGRQPRPARRRTNKRHFTSLAEFIAWKRERMRPRNTERAG